MGTRRNLAWHSYTNGRFPHEWLPVNGYRTTPARRGFRIVALAAAIIGVLALAAAAFVLSYAGLRDIVLHAGVTPRLARIYPAMFDAVVVVAGVTALSLPRNRGLLRSYAWLAMLIAIAGVAAADALHATSTHLARRPTELAVAIAPWVLLLIIFTLLFALVRLALPGKKGNGQTLAADNGQVPVAAEPIISEHVSNGTVPLSELLVTREKPAVVTGGSAPAGTAKAPAGAAKAEMAGADKAAAGTAKAEVAGAGAALAGAGAALAGAGAALAGAGAAAETTVEETVKGRKARRRERDRRRAEKADAAAAAGAEPGEDGSGPDGSEGSRAADTAQAAKDKASSGAAEGGGSGRNASPAAETVPAAVTAAKTDAATPADTKPGASADSAPAGAADPVQAGAAGASAGAGAPGATVAMATRPPATDAEPTKPAPVADDTPATSAGASTPSSSPATSASSEDAGPAATMPYSTTITTAEAPPLSLPIRPERDEPSDADAEPAPSFTRLRSTPTPPGD
jgi:hypothetical protein